MASNPSFKLRAVKQIPAREVPIELTVSRGYHVATMETSLEVSGRYQDGERTQYAERVVVISEDQWGEDGITDLAALMGKLVARQLGAELK